MPEVPKRQLSKGEILQQQRVSKYRKAKTKHTVVAKTKSQKQQALMEKQAEYRYQMQLAKRVKEQVDTDL